MSWRKAVSFAIYHASAALTLSDSLFNDVTLSKLVVFSDVA
jgi:hypothetical protein